MKSRNCGTLTLSRVPDSNRRPSGYEIDPLDRLDYVELGFKRNARLNYVEIGWNLWGTLPQPAAQRIRPDGHEIRPRPAAGDSERPPCNKSSRSTRTAKRGSVGR
jgi:hypothetical protein